MNSAKKTVTFESGATIAITARGDGRTWSISFKCTGSGKYTRSIEIKPLTIASAPQIVASIGHLALDQAKLDAVKTVIAQLQDCPEYASHLTVKAEVAADEARAAARPQIISY